MNLYFTQIEKEIEQWRSGIVKKSNAIAGAHKGFQEQTRKLMPRKVKDTITASMKVFTDTVMFGARVTTGFKQSTQDLGLAESDYLVLKHFKTYKATAIGEGAATGAGGFLFGFADMPTLLGMKLKFLFDCSELYGYDVNNPDERLFILYVFQVAFSSRNHRLKCFRVVENWDTQPPRPVDWEQFQIEYRDCLDFAKLLQLVPLIGAPIGALANSNLMERLRETAMNCYRMRRLKTNAPVRDRWA